MPRLEFRAKKNFADAALLSTSKHTYTRVGCTRIKGGKKKENAMLAPIARAASSPEVVETIARLDVPQHCV